MPTLRLIGDVHGRYHEYLPLLRGPDYTLQVGDLGLHYAPFQRADPLRHRAIAGNHDCYQQDSPDYFARQPFFLGDFGVHQFPGIPPIFYVRGAWSIDHACRQRARERGGPVTWWADEELSDERFSEAARLYADVRPGIVVTHEAPHDIVRHVTDPKFCEAFGYPAGTMETRTNRALQGMLDGGRLDGWRPERWIFGHYHRRWEGRIDGTEFTCLDMLGRWPVGVAGAVLDLVF